MTHTDSDYGYLAGFFDGEGSVNSRSLGITIGNSSRTVLYRFAKAFGGEVKLARKAGDYSMPSATYTIHRDIYQWALYGSNAINALSLMLPHLVEKQEQAMLALRVAELPRGDIRKKELFDRIRACKRAPDNSTNESIPQEE